MADKQKQKNISELNPKYLVYQEWICADLEGIDHFRDGREYTLVQHLEDYEYDESREGPSKHYIHMKLVYLYLLTAIDAKHMHPCNIMVLPEAEARNKWTVLAIEPEETLGERQITRSYDVKIFRDTRQAVKIYVSEEQSLVVRQVC
jgi:hypothetical protein